MSGNSDLTTPSGEEKKKDPDPHGWKQEGRDLLRGVAAGAIFGMPLLYTMEMWWHGLTLSEWHLLSLLAVILSINFVFSLFSGFREESSFPEALSESVTSVGIGILFSAVILWLIGELSHDLDPTEMIGKVLMEAMAVSVGVSFANTQVRKKAEAEEEEPEEKIVGEGDPERKQLLADLRDIGFTLAGSVLLAFSVAPTEEITLIATRLSPWQQLILLCAELLLCYIILFTSGLQERKVYMKDSIFQKPVPETLMASALSLAVAAGLFLLMGHHGGIDHLTTLASATVTLGLPAVVGGAAGRLIA